jgi:hypothetical protein
VLGGGYKIGGGVGDLLFVLLSSFLARSPVSVIHPAAIVSIPSCCRRCRCRCRTRLAAAFVAVAAVVAVTGAVAAAAALLPLLLTPWYSPVAANFPSLVFDPHGRASCEQPPAAAVLAGTPVHASSIDRGCWPPFA